jgi:DDE_Tnp_1-associated
MFKWWPREIPYPEVAMIADAAGSLLVVMRQVSDPRDRRGTRFPFASLLSLVFVAILSRHTEFAAMRRWAKAHWDLLCEPLGFDPQHGVPAATTLSRNLARFSLAQFQQAFSGWLRSALDEEGFVVAAVDGKASRNGLRESGDPLMMLNVFDQDVKACLGQWPLTGDKLTEPEVLKAHLQELFATYPALRLLTGDALYSQRNLAEIITASGHDYLFQIKGNQPDILDTIQHCFAAEKRDDIAARLRKKRGRSRSSFSLDRPRQRRICPR